jgi:AcrR family transcriptional regulator
MASTKRQEQKELTRRKIMDTAFDLYAKDGFFLPTSIIAEAANVSHGTIFVHFSTREVLQLCVLERFAEDMGKKLHSLSVEGENILGLLHAHISILEENESFYKNLISEMASLSIDARTIFVSMQSTLSYHFSLAIERERKAGNLKDVPIHMLFNSWVALLHYYLQNSELFAPGGSVLQRCGGELVSSFVTLISK